MKIASALVFVLLSIVALVAVIISLATEPANSQMVASNGTLLIYTVVALCIVVVLIRFHSRSNEVLCELNPNRMYQIVCKAHDPVGYKYVLSVIDIATETEHIACIHYAYPPKGFWEKKTPQGTLILVPEKLEPKPAEKLSWGWSTGGGVREVI